MNAPIDLDALERLIAAATPGIPPTDALMMAQRPWTSPSAQVYRQRFEAKLYMCPMSGCWLWTGSLDSQGYGATFMTRRTRVKAHRLSWELNVGPIPAGMDVLHRCDVPACVNPGHLFLGTHWDNMVDRTVKGVMKRRSPRYEYAGRQQCGSEWEDELGFARGTLNYRIRKLGWSIERAFTTRPRKSRTLRAAIAASARGEGK